MNAPELVFVGIDVSKDTLELALDDHSPTRRVSNDVTGIAQLSEELTALGARVGAIVIEATGGYERQVAVTLCLASLPVMVINPRQGRDFAKALGHLSKTDAIDARVLSHLAATLHASERRERLLMKVPEPQQEALQALIVRRLQLVGMRVAESNRLALSHRAQHKSIKAVLHVLDRQIAVIDRNIDGHLDEHFAGKLALLKGLKGVGRGTQASLMAGLPELGRLNRAQISKLVGIAPLNCDSGRHRGKRVTWGGRAPVRAALYMATLTAVQHDPTLMAFYQRLLANGKPAKVALVACMHKLLTIINAILKSGKPWSANHQTCTRTA